MTVVNAAGPSAARTDSRSREVLLLRTEELAEAVPLSVVIDAVERSYRLAAQRDIAQHARVPVREESSQTFLHVLPATSAAAGVAGAHVYTGGNRGADATQKVTLLFRTNDGGLRAIIESSWLSWARTGATGAVATRHLARPEASVLGLIGSGRQASAQLQAIAASRPLTGAFVFSRTRERRNAFARDMSRLTGIEVEPLASADEVVERSTIVSTVTTSHEPVFAPSAAKPGLHVNAIGAHYLDRREVDGRLMARARVFVDDAERSREEDGERALAVADGWLAAGAPVTALADVVGGQAPGRTSPDDVTVFLSGGLASEYLLAAAAVVERAEQLGLGTRVRL